MKVMDKVKPFAIPFCNRQCNRKIAGFGEAGWYV